MSEVIKDFERALENEENCDVIIKAGEEPKELRAHSFVLRTRCPYFKRALSENWEEKDDDAYSLLFSRYLYTGIIYYDQYSRDVILQSLIAADELGLDKLIERIQYDLIINEEFAYKDPIGILQIIVQYEPFENLKNHCLEIISEDPQILFSSEKFSSLEKPIITMILQRDDLNMEEIDIWDSLLRWLFVHYLKINKDESKWSSEDLVNVKQTIKEYIPLIRFYDISKEDFYLKVYPYKDLLPQDLLNDIFRYHMVPNSTPMLNFKPSRNQFDSVLVNFNVFKLFAKWIDKKDEDYTRQNMPYQFILLLRGTRDGFDSAKFHRLCDGEGATISFARVENSKPIIGGYNPLGWNQNSSYASTNDSFLFNITDIDNLNSAKISRSNNSNNAIYYHSNYGPTFGNGHDLRAQGKTWYTNIGDTYTNISMPNSNFTIDEYEVFKVLKLF
ncbi:hypothetical protein RirG_259280 [Rhizophagus irregularis DAOM 197198w]|uniref:Kelch-like protein 17 n=3 Tax=Rhizophagus irregularis TaxID=588596 RepID=A0A015JA27_RHIIW|nr:hypothetical protein RirG_259280 [Rhizophagus irregularis DAOM 197198w]